MVPVVMVTNQIVDPGGEGSFFIKLKKACYRAWLVGLQIQLLGTSRASRAPLGRKMKLKLGCGRSLVRPHGTRLSDSLRRMFLRDLGPC